MAKRKKAAHALETAAALNEVQSIIRRLVEDEELRDAVRTAIDSSRKVVDRVSSTRKPSKLLEDRKLQAEALEAYAAIRTVTGALTGIALPQPKKGARKQAKKKKKGGIGKLVVLAGVGGVVALAASEDLRSKVLDALFGAEEEFEYSPPPPASADAPGSPLSAV